MALAYLFFVFCSSTDGEITYPRHALRCYPHGPAVCPVTADNIQLVNLVSTLQTQPQQQQQQRERDHKYKWRHGTDTRTVRQREGPVQLHRLQPRYTSSGGQIVDQSDVAAVIGKGASLAPWNT